MLLLPALSSSLSIHHCMFASMAIHRAITALLFLLAMGIELSTCDVVKGSVSCLDCTPHYDLSGVKILVKCDQVRKLAMATTEDDGSFAAELPSDAPNSPSPLNCHGKLLGGPNQLYASRKNMVSKIVKAHDSNSYTISTPITVSTTCPFSRKNIGKCGEPSNMNFGSSKTVDLPLPKEWGLAPSSYYIPFIPIIGIP